MASRIETGFGAKLRRAENAASFISNWIGYEPPREKEKLSNIQDLLNQIRKANDAEAKKRSGYTTVVSERQAMFMKEDDSIDKLLTRIRGAADACFDRGSDISKQIAAVIKKTRAAKLIRLPADPANPGTEATLSRSQLSYGSKAKAFADLVNILEQSGRYTTSAADIQLPALQLKVEALRIAGDAVSLKLEEIGTARAERLRLYEDLNDRLAHVKDYAKTGALGLRSKEYRTLKSIGI